VVEAIVDDGPLLVGRSILVVDDHRHDQGGGGVGGVRDVRSDDDGDTAMTRSTTAAGSLPFRFGDRRIKGE